ncbi:MAG: 30S ribosomal protein S20, partial [Pirellulaceae bacterium]|nr:30S ribosomal protein S20 [Pirellulaceae bacterium]
WLPAIDRLRIERPPSEKNHDDRLQTMPNSNSATKRLRQNVTRRDRNRAVKSDLRTQLRKVHAAVAAGDVATAEAEFIVVAKKLDQAGSSKIMHRNTASRTKSRLQKAIKAVKQKAAQ